MEINQNRILEVEGVIEEIKTPFSFFKKKPPIVSIRVMSGKIIDMQATPELIKRALHIEVGHYTQAQYRYHSSGIGYQLVALL